MTATDHRGTKRSTEIVLTTETLLNGLRFSATVLSSHP